MATEVLPSISLSDGWEHGNSKQVVELAIEVPSLTELKKKYKKQTKTKKNQKQKVIPSDISYACI